MKKRIYLKLSPILSVGFNSDGESDFGISGKIHDLSYDEMNELRKMITVAIGTAEAMWRSTNEDNSKNETDNEKRIV